MDTMDTMNDVYLLLSGKQFGESDHTKKYIIYIPKEIYTNSETADIIEEVSYSPDTDELSVQPFFLNDKYVYPINLAGPAVSKVIHWNIETAEMENLEKNPALKDKIILDPFYFQPGYFIDLRQLKMSRLNMIHSPSNDAIPTIEDTPIPNGKLPETKDTFRPVPENCLHELTSTPPANLYIAYFEHPEKTHNNTEFYNYKVSCIPLEKIKKEAINGNNFDPNDHKKMIFWDVDKIKVTKDNEHLIYLQTYYGDAGVQAGALNPYDIQSSRDRFITLPTNPYPIVLAGGSGDGGGGSTCYVANLETFKKSSC